MAGPSLTIGPQTTIEDVRRFVDEHGGNKKIHGKVDKETGETTLYIGKKSPSLFALITGKWERRKEAAKVAIEQLVQRTFDDIKGSRTLSNADRAAIANLSEQISAQLRATGDHSVRGGLIRVLAMAAKGAEAYGREVTPDGGPKLSMLGDFGYAISGLAPGLKTGIESRANLKMLSDALGDAIAEQFKRLNPSEDSRMMFATAWGGDFKQQLLDAFRARIGEEAWAELAKTENFQQKVMGFIDDAYDVAAAKMTGNSQVQGSEKQVVWTKNGVARTATLSNIKIGGTVYEPVKHLGTGGYAEVFLYQEVKDAEPKKQIAFKLVNAPPQSPEDHWKMARELRMKAIEEGGAEIRAHRMLQGEGHKNVLGLSGVIRTPEGRFGIAMELAPGGDMLEFAKLLKNSVGTGPGKITPQMAEVVRLTLFKDMVEGLHHIQDTREGMHLDLKTPNVLIGPGGEAKISDFGLSTEGTEINIEGYTPPDNPTWLAPEVIHAKRNVDALRGLTAPKLDNVTKQVNRQLEDVIFLHPEPEGASNNDLVKIRRENKQALKILTGSILQPVIRQNVEGIGITNKSDTWALGIMGVDLWSGQQQFLDFAWNADVEGKLVAFRSDRNNVAIGYQLDSRGNPVGTGEPLFESTGHVQVDSLLNDLLRPDPDDRPDLQTVLNNPLFSQPGVGSSEVRALILALKEGDPDKIDGAFMQLGAKIIEDTVNA